MSEVQKIKQNLLCDDEFFKRSRYSDWPRAGRPRARNLSPGRGKNFLHIVQTGSVAHSASCPMGKGGSFPVAKAAGAWSWPLASSYSRDQENMDLYIRPPIRLNGVVL
jgi:hypothetical protein